MIRARRGAVLIAIVAALICGLDRRAGAHSGLRFSSPLDGATLGDGPSEVRLTFVEAPEPSLSTVRVVDTNGNAFQTGTPQIAAGDPLSLIVPLRKPGKGIYLVHWRAVSAVDGHASSGVFAFGVLIDPAAAGAAPVADTTVAAIEVVARTAFLAGLMLLLGASAAGLWNFGSQRELIIVAVAWLVAIIGLAMLAVAQVRVAGVDISALAGTTIGRALAWRLFALVVAAAAIVVAVQGKRAGHARLVRMALGGVALAALGAIVAHSAAGHAAAGRWPAGATIAIQIAHIAAAGIWLGGLAALIAGLKSEPSASRAGSVRRFSSIAAVGLLVVTGSGIARGFQEVSAWSDFVTTTYRHLDRGEVRLADRHCMPRSAQSLAQCGEGHHGSESTAQDRCGGTGGCNGGGDRRGFSRRAAACGVESRDCRHRNVGLRLWHHGSRPSDGGVRSAGPQSFCRRSRRLRFRRTGDRGSSQLAVFADR